MVVSPLALIAGGLLEDRQDVLHRADLLLADQDERVLVGRRHLVGVGDEVGRDIAAVELHALDHVELSLEALCFLDGDHALVADLFHRLGEVVADFLVAVGGDRSNLGDFGVRGDLLRVFLQLLDHGLDRKIDAALEVHRVHARGHRLRAFLDDRGGKHRRGRGAVTGDVGGLRGDLAHHLRAHVLELVLKLDFLGDGDAVFGDAGSAEALVEDDVAALGAERHLHRVGEDVDATQQTLARIAVKPNFFGSHVDLSPE